MINGFEVTGTKKIDRYKNYIDKKKRTLVIKTIRFDVNYTFVTYMKRVDPVNGEVWCVVFSTTDVSRQGNRVWKTGFGYLNATIDAETFRALGVKTDVNVEFMLIESNEDNVIFSLGF